MGLEIFPSKIEKNFSSELKKKKRHKSKPDSENKGTVRTGSNRGNYKESPPEHSLRSSEKRFPRDKVGTGCQLSQHLHFPIQIHNVDRSSPARVVASKLLDGNSGPKKCLLACPYRQKVQKLPSFSSGRKGLPLQGSAFWIKYSPPSIHQIDVTRQEKVHRTRSNNGDVSGRLDHLRSNSSSLRTNDRKGDLISTRHGSAIQLPKIQSSSVPKHPISGLHLELSSTISVPVHRQPEQNSNESFEGFINEPNDPKRVGINHRIAQLSMQCARLRQGEEEETGSPREKSLSCETSRHSCSISNPIKGSIKVVDSSSKPGSNLHLEKTSPKFDSNHGCFISGMGLPNQPRPSGQRVLVQENQEISSHKCKGVVDGLTSTPKRAVNKGHGDTGSVRQHDSRVLPESARHSEKSISSTSVRRHIPDCRDKEPQHCKHLCTGLKKCLGRCAFKKHGFDSRSLSKGGDISVHHTGVGTTTNRSICQQDEQQSSILSLPKRDNSSGRTGCSVGQLEQVGIHLPVPTTSHETDGENNQQTETFSRPGNIDCSILENPDMDADSSTVVSQSPEIDKLSNSRSGQSSSGGITKLTRLEFLQKCLKTKKYSNNAIEYMSKGLAVSTTRQYQSGWKHFQKFILDSNLTEFDSSIFTNFAASLLSRGLKPATVNTHLAAIKDPLVHIGIEPNQRDINLLLKGSLRDKPVIRQLPPSWSLDKVLEELKNKLYSSDMERLVLRKALFLVALGTGWRVSTLAALVRSPDYCRFISNSDSMFLLPSPNFTSKRENPAEPLKGVSVPAWKLRDGSHHPLCPVDALRKYISLSGGFKTDGSSLWLNCQTRSRIERNQLSQLLCETIEKADPKKSPKGHDFRKYATTLAYMQVGSTHTVAQLGQWSSDFCVKYHYFIKTLKSTNCVAMGIQTHDVGGHQHLQALEDEN